VAVEVAYQRSPDQSKSVALPKAFPGRPCIMVTRDALEWHERYALVPAALFLWALGQKGLTWPPRERAETARYTYALVGR